MKQSIYDRLLSGLICLGVGTMLGDAVLHLVPLCLGLHAHAHGVQGGHDTEDGHAGHEGHGGHAEEEEERFV